MARSIAAIRWRTTALLCSASYLLFSLPLSYIVKNRPEDMGLLPDGEEKLYKGLGSGAPIVAEADYSVSEAMRTQTFWVLMLGECFRSFLLGSMVLHQIPYLVSLGVAEETAATILGLMIFLSIPGRLVFGSLGDFYNKRLLLTLTMLRARRVPDCAGARL